MTSSFIITVRHIPPHRYELMLNCWKDEAERRPTFKEMVSRYHDGLIPGTSKAEHGQDYVLLGPEENSTEHQQTTETSLSETSEIDISMITKDSKATPTPSAGHGTSFNVIFLNSREPQEGQQVLAASLDQEYYMEMNSFSRLGASVLVNQAALHEYDDVAQDHQEVREEANSHVTIEADHVTEAIQPPSTHSNKSQKLHSSTGDYILMQATGHNVTS